MLASLTDLDSRIPGVEYDEETALGLLQEASILVESYLGKGFKDPIPETIRVVVSRMVARVIEAPKETAFQQSSSFTAGPFGKSVTHSHGGSGGAPWLTASDKTMLAPYRRRRRGLHSITMQ